ncbi:MAG: hypothetical protein HY747_01360 [Elusimicrobia bacterium]|nr:hypothetical protein [Elusimicrobiota bacterium]
MDQIKKFSLFVISFLPATALLAADGLAWHGFLQTSHASRLGGTSDSKTASGDFLFGEERLQLSLSGSAPGEPVNFQAKTDFFHDEVAGENRLEIREANLNYAAEAFEIRLGRQIVTWGTGDLLFINDVFPKDWTALFSGKPLEYLKLGAGALKGNFYAKGFTLEALAMPSFEPDRMPSSDRFVFFDPFSRITQRTTVKPKGDLENVETALRVARPISRWDTALYAYRGFYRSPVMMPDSFASPTALTISYPKLAVYGFSVQGPGAGGLLGLEGGFYDSRQDRFGSDPIVPNSHAAYLLGYQRQLGADFTAGLQYYGEQMMRYDRYKSSLPAGFPQAHELRQLLTLRLTQFFKYQTWRLSLFGYWSPTDEDFYFIPEARHTLSDGIWLALGGNIFGGAKDNTFFGQFDKNDNFYLAMRYEF